MYQAHKNKPIHDLRHYLKIRDDDSYLEHRQQVHRNYRLTPKGRRLSREGVRKWRKDHAVEVRAHKALNYAVSVGKIKRPESCERCGQKPKPRSDGRSGLHAHHKDYRKKLEVQWLCAFCHGNERRRW